MTRLHVAIAVLSASLLTACPSDDTPIEPPLRPLVYTESASAEGIAPVAGYEMWWGETDPTAYPDEPPVLQSAPADDRVAPDQVDLSTPEALARALFRALSQQDERLLEHLIMPPDEYARAARTSTSRALEHIELVRADTALVRDLFAGEVPSEQRPGGLGSMLELESVSVRSRRLVTGEVVRGDAPGEMVLGTEIMMRLRNTEQIFRIRLPKVLASEDGQWRLAEAPEIGGQLRMFVEMGLHLSPTLLAFEHYPLPYETGNYWTYQIRVEPRQRSSARDARPDEPTEGTGAEASAEEAGAGIAADPDLPSLRIDVIEREDYDGYSLVRLRHTWNDPERHPDYVSYFLTARRVFACNRDCRRNIENVDWLLAHFARRTPELVFPLLPGIGWRTGGRLSDHGEYQTRSRYEVAHVPAGRFEETIHVTRSVVEGREHRYFALGIGMVLTRKEGASETTFLELTDYRIIP